MEGLGGARLPPNHPRLLTDLRHLSALRTVCPGGWRRRAFSAEHSTARRWLREQMKQAGLQVSFDGAANMVGRRPGERDDLDPIVIGSHLDALVGDGRFDGTLGALAGIEIARCLQERGIVLQHPLEIVDFVAQEPLESGDEGTGAQLLATWAHRGGLRPPGARGQTFGGLIAMAGGHADPVVVDARAPGSIAAFLELAVEHGSSLAAEGVSVGIVSELPSASRLRGTLACHADVTGRVPPDARQVVLAAVEEIAEELKRLRDAWESAQTMTRLVVDPNGPGLVPGGVELWIEIQSPDWRNFERVWEFKRTFEETAQRRGLNGRIGNVGGAGGRRVSQRVQAVLEETIRDLRLPVRHLPGPTIQAASWLASVGPVGVLLYSGQVGSGDRSVQTNDLSSAATGVAVLGEAVLRIDARLASGERLWPAQEWLLLDGDRTWLGTLIVVGADQPWWFCNFEARPAFESVRSLFEELDRVRRARITENYDGDTSLERLNETLMRIWARGIRLESRHNAEYYSKPLLYIRGRRAELRGLADNWREVRSSEGG